MKDVMKAVLARSALGAWIGKIPFVPELYAKRVWSRRMNMFIGAHDRVEGAERFAARFHQVGWNDGALANHVIEDAPELFQTSQFAVMLWLTKLIKSDSVVLDLGGAGGTFYEICRRYDLLPPGSRWHVVDVPEMVTRGIARHEALRSPGISFGTDPAQAPASDILLMLGAIQYLPDPLGEKGQGVLESLKSLPEHILINKIPLTDSPNAWVVQNHVTSAVPYRLFNRQAFMGYFEARGYRLRDRWLVPELSIDVAFRPDRSLTHLEGVHFERLATV